MAAEDEKVAEQLHRTERVLADSRAQWDTVFALVSRLEAEMKVLRDQQAGGEGGDDR